MGLPFAPPVPILRMMVEIFPEIGRLSIEEKRRLMNELWEEVVRSEDRPDPAMVKLLEERWRHYEQHPESAVSLEEFRRRIGAS